MPVIYHYKAIDKAGHPARGQLEAANDVDLELRLKRMGLDLITCRAIKKSTAWLFRPSITRQDLITLCFYLEHLTLARVPLLEALAYVRESVENPRLREVISSILEDMEGGKMFSDALASHPKIFDNVFISLIRAGEQTGKLTEIFNDLAATLKWQDELIAQTRQLLIYPALVFVVVLCVSVFLMVYLVPQLTSLLKNMGQELPWQTKFLIFLSDALSHYWVLFVGLPLIAAGGLIVLVQRNRKANYLMDYLKLNAPIIGSIHQKIILARFANAFALMYQSGITILDAIKTSESVVANRVLAEGLQRASQRINAGDSLADSFRSLGVFPPLVLRMLRMGETSGALDKALLTISYFYSREAKDAVERGLKLMEPLLTVILGMVLAAILFSVLMPVYEILGKLKI